MQGATSYHFDSLDNREDVISNVLSSSFALLVTGVFFW